MDSILLFSWEETKLQAQQNNWETGRDDLAKCSKLAPASRELAS
jgi:hypothetical protein